MQDDLALLDDETRHACCIICHPDDALGVPFTALCGRRAIAFRGHADDPPPNACPDCLELWDEDEPCPVCAAFGVAR